MNFTLVFVGCSGSGLADDNVGELLKWLHAGFAGLGGESPDFAISGSFTPSANGVFTGSLSGFDLLSGSSANTFTLYLVDNTQGVAIETDRAQLTLARFALVE